MVEVLDKQSQVRWFDSRMTQQLGKVKKKLNRQKNVYEENRIKEA